MGKRKHRIVKGLRETLRQRYKKTLSCPFCGRVLSVRKRRKPSEFLKIIDISCSHCPFRLIVAFDENSVFDLPDVISWIIDGDYDKLEKYAIEFVPGE